MEANLNNFLKGKFPIAVLVLLILGLMGWMLKTEKNEKHSSLQINNKLPMHLLEWNGKESSFDSEFSDEDIVRIYDNPKGESVFLYIGYHKNILKDIPGHTPLNCYPSQGWKIISRDVVLVPHGNSYLKINKLLIQKEGNKQVVFYWFQRNSKVYLGKLKDLIVMLLDSFFTNDSDAAFVRISSELNGFTGEEIDLSDFLEKLCRQLIPLI